MTYIYDRKPPASPSFQGTVEPWGGRGPSPPHMQPPSLQEAALTDSSRINKTRALESCVKSPVTPQTPVPSHGHLAVTPADSAPTLHSVFPETKYCTGEAPTLNSGSSISVQWPSAPGISQMCLGHFFFQLPATQQLTPATTSELMEPCHLALTTCKRSLTCSERWAVNDSPRSLDLCYLPN